MIPKKTAVSAAILGSALTGLAIAQEVEQGQPRAQGGDKVAAAPGTCVPLGSIIYVDASAIGADDGSSWTDAYVDLQDALAVARACPDLVDEVWVASGIYAPAPPGGDRSTSFELANRIGLYGGFGGWETLRGQRDWVNNRTILSGDINHDDPDGEPGPGGSCCTGHDAPGCDDSTCQTAVCDVNSRCCDEAWYGWCTSIAAGVCCHLCGDNTRACENSYHVVTGNWIDATTVLDGFTITDGNARVSFPSNAGGGLFNIGGAPLLRNCTFVGNTGVTGGGLYNLLGNPVLRNCAFTDNHALSWGGGILTGDGSLTLDNCTLSGNWASEVAGGIGNSGSILALANCTLTANSADVGGGAIYSYDSAPTLVNCILWGNTAPSSPQVDGESVVITYSNIEAGWPGVGNIDDDPLFVEAAGGDLRLTQCSPCIDVGDNASVPADIDTDLDGNPRIFNEIVDMGAYELQSSLPCPEIVILNPNGDETWALGVEYMINWSWPGAAAGDVEIDLLKGGEFREVIATSTPDDGSFAWTPGHHLPGGSDYLVRISSTLHESISDISDADFSLAAVPTFTVTAPNGGETWTAGTTETVSWESTSPYGDVSICLLRDGELCTDTCEVAYDGECDDGGPGASWDLCEYGTDCFDCGPRVAGGASSDCIDAIPMEDESFDWPVCPYQEPGSGYRVQVGWSEFGLYAEDQSDGPFDITGGSPWPTVPGDVDGDNDVDLADFSRLIECYQGSDHSVWGCICVLVDFDQDGDVDLQDFSIFWARWITGHNDLVGLATDPDTGEEIDFYNLMVGDTITITAPSPTKTRQPCACAWSVDPTTTGTFSAADDCVTDFTLDEAGDFTITVVVTCDGADTMFNQDGTASEPSVIPCSTDADCYDGLFCNGAELCDTDTGDCLAGTRPCDDNNGAGCDDPDGLATEECSEGDTEAVCMPCPGETLDFTLSQDSLIGTTRDDIFNAPLIFNPWSGTQIASLQTGDSANGLAGNDTLNATFNTAGWVVPYSIAGIEILNIMNFASGTVMLSSTNISGVDTLNSVRSVNDVAITGLQELTDCGFKDINDTTVDLALTFAQTATTDGGADAFTCTLENATVGTLTVTTNAANGFETMNLVSNGTDPNRLTRLMQVAGNTMATATFTGTADLRVDSMPNTVLTYNAAAMTGGLQLGSGTDDTTYVEFATAALTQLTGGTGDDLFIFGNTLTSADFSSTGETLECGDGTDVVQNSFAATNGAASRLRNCEEVRYNASASGVSVNFTWHTGLDTITIEEDGTANTFFVLNVPAISGVFPTLNFRGDNTQAAQTYDTITYIAVGATGSSDTLAITVGNRGTTLNSGSATINVHTIGGAALSAAGFEVATIDVTDGPATFNGLTMLALTTLTVTSSSNVMLGTVSPVAATGLVQLDASAVTGNFTVTIVDLASGGVVTTGDGNDTVTITAGSPGTSSFITLGAGNDVFTGDATTDSADTIDAGAGHDTLQPGDGTDTVATGTGNDFVIYDQVLAVDEIDISDFTPGTGGDKMLFEQSDLSLNGITETVGTMAAVTAAGTYINIVTTDGYATDLAAETAFNAASVLGDGIEYVIVYFNTATTSSHILYDADADTDGTSILLGNLTNITTQAAHDTLTAVNIDTRS